MRPSFATRLNLDVLEENYRRWQENPEALDPSWSAFFEGFELGNLEKRNGAAAPAKTADTSFATRVDGLVYAY
ncbi:MAG: 2-oxoglutarate dehydrogenase E1 subunit family protein, partial [Chthoniobacterales bacterium]